MNEMPSEPWEIKWEDENHFIIEANGGQAAICYGAGWYGENQPQKHIAHLLVNAPKLRRLLAGLVDALDNSESAVLKRGYLNTDKEQAALLSEARQVLDECDVKP